MGKNLWTDLDNFSQHRNVAREKLSELKISPNTKIDPNETLKLVNEIIKEINKGANINSLAKQFSSANSKINNGKLGWIKETAITKDILKIIQKTQVGQITQPIKINEINDVIIWGVVTSVVHKV